MDNKIELLQQQLQSERKLVSFDSYDMSVRQIVDMFKSREIVIPEEYQRQFVWDAVRQSELIESLFIGIPVPSLFMATNPDSSWEVVDGMQRLCTISRFVDSDLAKELPSGDGNLLKLSNLQKLDKLNDFVFSDLPRSVQLFFLNRVLKITVLNDKSDLDVRYDLFERLNTGGVSLTPQEIRNCVYRGIFNDELKLMAGSESFNNVIKLKPADANNGTREELALRFFAFLNNYQNFDHSVRDFLNHYMRDNVRKDISDVDKKLFFKTFAFIDKELKDGIIRGGRKITPINLFEAIAVGVALAIKSKGSRVKKNVLAKLLDDDALTDFTTGATNSQKMVAGRIHYVRDALV